MDSMSTPCKRVGECKVLFVGDILNHGMMKVCTNSSSAHCARMFKVEGCQKEQ
jgi:hypothetical protein